MQTRRERLREATREEIKHIARQQMIEEGPSGLSLNAIAHRMGLTGPALYRYFPTRDALVLTLLTEAFTKQAETMKYACSNERDDFSVRFLGAVMAYRKWAIEHPIDYILIAGTPIPGFMPPRDLVTAAARKGMDLFVGIVDGALAAHALQVPEVLLTAALRETLAQFAETHGYTVPLELLHLLIAGWSEVQGIVTLEIFHQFENILNDPGEFYRCEAYAWLTRLGFIHIPPLE